MSVLSSLICSDPFPRHPHAFHLSNSWSTAYDSLLTSLLISSPYPLRSARGTEGGARAEREGVRWGRGTRGKHDKRRNGARHVNECDERRENSNARILRQHVISLGSPVHRVLSHPPASLESSVRIVVHSVHSSLLTPSSREAVRGTQWTETEEQRMGCIYDIKSKR